MYLLIIALGLLLLWLLLGGFAKTDHRKIARVMKNLKWYVISAFFLLLGLWFIFSGKFYLSWVTIFGFLPLLKRLLLGAIYLWGANMMRRAFSPMGLLNAAPKISMSRLKAVRLLEIDPDESSEMDIVEAYLAAKKRARAQLSHAPDLYKDRLAELAAARDVLIAAKKKS